MDASPPASHARAEPVRVSTKRNVLALVALVGSTALALSLVPRSAWAELHEPSVRACWLMLVVLASLLVLRRGGARNALRERQLLCSFLGAMPLVYLESGLWHDARSWLLVEGAGLCLFAGWAWLAYRRDAVWLALGIAGHGLLWDAWHHTSSYIPAWYTRACLVVDLGLALYVLLQRDRLAVVSLVASPAGEGPVPLDVPASTKLPQETGLPALDAPAAAVRAEMLRELATTLRTLEREYRGPKVGEHGDGAEKNQRDAAGIQDIRIVLTRVRLLLPSLCAGRMVVPDAVAQRRQASEAAEQSLRERTELGLAAAVARHEADFARTLEAVLEASRLALGADADQTPSVRSLETLTERVERAQRATHVLQLTLAAE